MATPLGRSKAIEIRPSAYLDILRRAGVTNLPADAVIKDSFRDPWTRNAIYIIESAEFPEVPEGEQFEIMALELGNDACEV